MCVPNCPHRWLGLFQERLYSKHPGRTRLELVTPGTHSHFALVCGLHRQKAAGGCHGFGWLVFEHQGRPQSSVPESAFLPKSRRPAMSSQSTMMSATLNGSTEDQEGHCRAGRARVCAAGGVGRWDPCCVDRDVVGRWLGGMFASVSHVSLLLVSGPPGRKACFCLQFPLLSES